MPSSVIENAFLIDCIEGTAENNICTSFSTLIEITSSGGSSHVPHDIPQIQAEKHNKFIITL
jgi:hypothetical protein